MDDSLTDMISAPWTTILTVAAGYAGYFIAHVGVREHHQPLDQALRVITYGFWSLFAYMMLRTYAGFGVLSASLAAVLVGSSLGALWRKQGRHLLGKVLRETRVSMSDDAPSAWAALAVTGDSCVVSEIKVRLKDGTILFSDDLTLFGGHPDGPCVLGTKGDILMYVTDIARPNADGSVTWQAATDHRDEGYGSMITYIPADEVARVSLRRSAR